MPRYSPNLALALIAGSAVVAGAADARACSCTRPHVTFLTPDREDDAPLNTRVRFEVPLGGGTSGAARRVLRVHGSSAEVAVAEQTFAGGSVEVVELAPRAPLSPATRYEVAIVDPSEHPSTLVFGTFQTGTAADTAAPVLKNGGTAEALKNPHATGADCSIPGPWIDIIDAVADDPSRPKAQLLWGVWTKGPSGKIDASKPPATIVAGRGNRVTLGQRSLCDPRGFALPHGGVFSFGVAPIDEAGNVGPMKTHLVDMSAPRLVGRP